LCIESIPKLDTSDILQTRLMFKMLTFYILFVFGVRFIHGDLTDLYPGVDSNVYVSNCKSEGELLLI
jgi:hypothetical protein